MKKIYLLLLIAFMAFQGNAQVDVPPLIITEWTGAGSQDYIELTNVGTEEIVLDSFSVHRIISHCYYSRYVPDSAIFEFGNLADLNMFHLSGTLAAGESYVLMDVRDEDNGTGLPVHNIPMLAVADTMFYAKEQFAYEYLDKPEWEAYAFDSIQAGGYASLLGTNPISGSYNDGIGLHYNPLSLYVDQVNMAPDPDFPWTGEGDKQGEKNSSVAGMSDVVESHTYVRKSTVTEGNVDWDLARGSTFTNSEWLPIPISNSRLDLFTTVGEHGDFSLDYPVKDPSKVILDETNKTLTVPWKTIRGDSLSHLFTLGKGMSWGFTENPDDASDSVHYNVQNGDIFTLYATGDDLERIDLTISVTAPGNDLAIAYPKRRQNFDEDLNLVYWPTGYVYGVTQGLDVDSIYNVPFATPVDTLLKYMEKPSAANWEIIFVGGETRADLKDGDKLKVISENSSVEKEYLIEVDDYVGGTNVSLSMISWPDVDRDTYWQWESDTIPGFSSATQVYFIKLAAGTTTIPALQFKAEDVNSTLEVTRAIDINGSIEQRTTTVKVIAEDGTTSRTYEVQFAVETVPVQPNFAEPFFSEIMIGHQFSGMAVEICNPGNQDLDLSKYMVVRAVLPTHSFSTAVSSVFVPADGKDSEFNRIYRSHYVPSKRWKHDEDLAAWKVEPGFLVDDNIVDPIVKANDVFVFGNETLVSGRWNADGTPAKIDMDLRAEYDFFFNGEVAADAVETLNPWGLFLRKNNTVSYSQPKAAGKANNHLFLVKVLNDTVLDGSKDVKDPNDYEIVDRFQQADDVDAFYVAGRDLSIPNTNGWTIMRKPEVWKGVTGKGEGLGANGGQSEEGSQYFVHNYRDEGRSNDDMDAQDLQASSIGWHNMEPMKGHISSITSVRLLVSEGYEGDLTITGGLAGLTDSTFKALLDKAHEDQILLMKSGGVELTSTDAVSAGDSLFVTSANGKNTSGYKLVESPLSTDNLLVAVGESGLAVALTDGSGTVSGVAPDATIKFLVENLTVPGSAVMNVIDADNNLVSLVSINFDSLEVDMQVGPNVMLEVVAENGDAAIYSLDMGISASEAVLLSNVFTVDQVYLAVEDVPNGISVQAILDLVFPNENATIKVTDKYGFERTSGQLNLDDLIEVSSEDQSVTVAYFVNFIEEANPDAGINMAPEASVSGPTEAEIGVAISFTATATDDNYGGSSLTYLWEITAGNASAAAISAPDQLSTDVTFSEAGSFDLSFTASDGDLSTSVVKTIETLVSVELNDMSMISIYPNPAKDMLYVEFAGTNTSARVQIIDMLGKVAYDKKHENTKAEIALDHFSNGMYFISIEIDNQVSVSKLSILK